ncbi:cell division protein FtsL [Alkalibacterium sp. MB6]|uniref:cell division protein FtsL n=1 Tax=Alkalibacterium sp. MB6 TaxID=2081965 RepID=UPI00137A3D86|nr:cell division protein FtsL [Alkalibacterium sp. MB6]
MMNDNLARQLVNEAEPLTAQPLREPSITPSGEPKKGQKTKPIHKVFTQLEIAVLSLFGIILLAIAVGHIALSMQLSTMNRTIQDLETQAVTVQIQNENYEQKIHELSRYDRVYSIAKDHGLEMNEEQIRNVFK